MVRFIISEACRHLEVAEEINCINPESISINHICVGMLLVNFKVNGFASDKPRIRIFRNVSEKETFFKCYFSSLLVPGNQFDVCPVEQRSPKVSTTVS